MPCCPLSYGALRYRSRDVSHFQQTLLMITATCKLVIDVGIRKARWQGPVLRVLAGFRRCDALITTAVQVRKIASSICGLLSFHMLRAKSRSQLSSMLVFLFLADCMKNTANTNECKLLREDYQECLHHTKEVTYSSLNSVTRLTYSVQLDVCFWRK